LRRERHLVPDTTQAPQPKSVGPDDAFHMRKSHPAFFSVRGATAEGSVLAMLEKAELTMTETYR
jgi:hypothetical protein